MHLCSSFTLGVCPKEHSQGRTDFECWLSVGPWPRPFFNGLGFFKYKRRTVIPLKDGWECNEIMCNAWHTVGA